MSDRASAAGSQLSSVRRCSLPALAPAGQGFKRCADAATRAAVRIAAVAPRLQQLGTEVTTTTVTVVVEILYRLVDNAQPRDNWTTLLVLSPAGTYLALSSEPKLRPRDPKWCTPPFPPSPGRRAPPSSVEKSSTIYNIKSTVLCSPPFRNPNICPGMLI